ncbi:MAG: hypothetical protein RIR00_501 [Pseudomonadota bacterium]|jgi:hypothetical protein
MNEEMLKHMQHLMSQAGPMAGKALAAKPLAAGSMLAAGGMAAGQKLLGATLLRNPLTLLAVGAAGGLAAGFLLFKYQKEVVEGLSRLGGMGKDFALHQRENLNDLLAEAEEKREAAQPGARP